MLTPKYITETLPAYADTHPATPLYDFYWALYFAEYDFGLTTAQGNLEGEYYPLVTILP